MVLPILLGTYTQKSSKGIYQVELDTEKKRLQNLKLIVAGTNPTYLVKSSQGYLYAVYEDEHTGGIGVYDPRNGTLLEKVFGIGAPLCYLGIDEQRQFLYGANYEKGELNIYQFSNSGNLRPVTSFYHYDPIGPHQNQDAPHVHYSNLTPDGRLITCDLGTDRVYCYDVDEIGQITTCFVYQAQPGTGPRHLVFNPNGRYIYLVGELDCSVSILSYDRFAGIKFISKHSTKPSDWACFNSAAAIRLNVKTNTLYVSNRGHDSIAVFSLSIDGSELRQTQQVHTQGHFPRDFNIDPSGRFLVVGHQYSDYLTLFEIDADEGTLIEQSHEFYAPEVVCVYFE